MERYSWFSISLFFWNYKIVIYDIITFLICKIQRHKQNKIFQKGKHQMLSNCWINSQLCRYYGVQQNVTNKCRQHNISHDRHINTAKIIMFFWEKRYLITIIILSLAAVGFKSNICYGQTDLRVVQLFLPLLPFFWSSL